MKALVDQWRVHFNKQSLGETPLNFPFGYVQVGIVTGFYNFGFL